MSSKSNEPKASWESHIKDGDFKRQDRTFRDAVSAEPGAKYPAAKGRYHLYVALACPWAHRALTVRKLKGLEDVISVDVVDYFLPSQGGWTMKAEHDGETGDSVAGRRFIRDVYHESDPDYNDSYTVPVLYDKQSKRIVNNESSEIIRQLNSEFNEWATRPELDLYPEDMRDEIDAVNEWVYHDINNGVYKCGFAQKQDVYEQHFKRLAEGLQRAEDLLAERPFLAGDRFTEADVRLWTTLVRFDPVYAVHFKCMAKRINEYPNLWALTRQVYQLPGVSETVNMHHIKHHYYESHESVNPFGLVPVGPLGYEESLTEPHDRKDAL